MRTINGYERELDGYDSLIRRMAVADEILDYKDVLSVMPPLIWEESINIVLNNIDSFEKYSGNYIYCIEEQDEIFGETVCFYRGIVEEGLHFSFNETLERKESRQRKICKNNEWIISKKRG